MAFSTVDLGSILVCGFLIRRSGTVITKDWVVSEMHKQTLAGYEWIADYIAKVAEGCRCSAMLPDNLEGCVTSTIKQMRSFNVPISEITIRKILLETLAWEALVSDIPLEVQQIQPPEKPSSDFTQDAEMQRKLLLTKHQEDLRLNKEGRSISSFKAGERLVSAALQMEGWFHWIPSSSETFKQDLPHTSSKEEGKQRNDFVAWLTSGGKEPAKDDWMNCWEAVFFTTYKAKLQSKEEIMLLHKKALSSGEYDNVLMGGLGFDRSFPMIPEIGLMPRMGDIVFVAQDHHVAICVDCTDKDTFVMSHWKHPKEGFCKVDLEDFGGLLTHVRFAPCPYA